MRDGGERRVARQDWGDLVRRLRGGDAKAVDELVAHFEERLRCIILARTRSLEAARELAHEVIAQALRGLRDGQDSVALPAYIHGIARNVIDSQWRDTEGRWLATAPIEDSLRTQVARDAIAVLNASDRKILEAFLVDGSDLAAIADKLGLRLATVEQRKTRALQRFWDEVRRRTPEANLGRRS